MGLIIKDKIPMFKVGYPTISDKYNVAGGILTGTEAVNFGDLVRLSDTTGYYSKIDTLDSASKIAGFVVATNVKLPSEYQVAKDSVKVLPGEAFNLALPGTYLAIRLHETAPEVDIKPNGKVYVDETDYRCTPDSSHMELPNVVFTGLYEKHGDKNIIAEIYIK